MCARGVLAGAGAELRVLILRNGIFRLRLNKRAILQLNCAVPLTDNGMFYTKSSSKLFKIY